ncbi:hypothetical protein ES692_16230 [Psychroserpens burtonensis]|uniref:Uncharacterized protein n=1 Tax=Psychroserpens burtonensis TaxID=49278 RepID=A0A5C7B511_9FLAO|nr:hypothetical protein [Psychroserpens burtonensis]TXE15529.1 hypothetical protein ES692_16230 [Psychroserpens burtonensis]
MKQDIRNLFKDDEISGQALPDNHRQDFYEQLKASRPRRTSQLNRHYLIKVAAIITMFLALTITLFQMVDNTPNQVVEASSMETQIDAIEKQYLARIDREWQRFISVTNDETLVKRYKDKLNDLDADYKEISQQFKTDTNNILVIESLVENLQTRLQLLKDIQEHINVLNQKIGTV